MRVLVKWLYSPRKKYGIPRSSGVTSYVDAGLAKKIEKESPGMLLVIKKEKPAEKPKQEEVHTRSKK